SPTIAVVTNIDREHMDFYQNMERLNESFLEFINKVPFYGLAVLCLDHPNVRALIPKVKKRFVTYGFSPEAEYTAQDVDIPPMEVEFTVARADHAALARAAQRAERARRRRDRRGARDPVREDRRGPRSVRRHPAPLRY